MKQNVDRRIGGRSEAALAAAVSGWGPSTEQALVTLRCKRCRSTNIGHLALWTPDDPADGAALLVAHVQLPRGGARSSEVFTAQLLFDPRVEDVVDAWCRSHREVHFPARALDHRQWLAIGSARPDGAITPQVLHGAPKFN